MADLDCCQRKLRPQVDTATNYGSYGKGTQGPTRLWTEGNWMKEGNGSKSRSILGRVKRTRIQQRP